MSLLCLFSVLLGISARPSEPIKVYGIDDRRHGLTATVILVPVRANRGFFAIDDPGMTGDVRRHWKPGYSLLINGGYFTSEFAPVGFNRIGGVTISKRRSMLSGFVAIDKAGALSLLTRRDDLRKYPTVIQSGPYIVDPGGSVGIKSDSGATARRTAIGRLKNGAILIVSTRPITLSGFAHAMIAHYPNLDRLLNLDGGPSTAMKAEGVEILNYTPVRNYIGRLRN